MNIEEQWQEFRRLLRKVLAAAEDYWRAVKRADALDRPSMEFLEKMRKTEEARQKLISCEDALREFTDKYAPPVS